MAFPIGQPFMNPGFGMGLGMSFGSVCMEMMGGASMLLGPGSGYGVPEFGSPWMTPGSLGGMFAPPTYGGGQAAQLLNLEARTQAVTGELGYDPYSGARSYEMPPTGGYNSGYYPQPPYWNEGEGELRGQHLHRSDGAVCLGEGDPRLFREWGFHPNYDGLPDIRGRRLPERDDWRNIRPLDGRDDVTVGPHRNQNDLRGGDLCASQSGWDNRARETGRHDDIGQAGRYNDAALRGWHDKVSQDGVGNRAGVIGSRNKVNQHGVDNSALVHGRWDNVLQTGRDNSTRVSGDNDTTNVHGSNNTVVTKGRNDTVNLNGSNQNVTVDGDGIKANYKNGKWTASGVIDGRRYNARIITDKDGGTRILGI